MLVRVFQHYECSRSAYKIIRNDHQLPSGETLGRITSKIENTVKPRLSNASVLDQKIRDFYVSDFEHNSDHDQTERMQTD